jgi:hypothetical protein
MTPKSPSVLIIGACAFFSGCRVTQHIPTTAEARSPNGAWLATADSKPGSAFGGGYVLTDVNLKGPSSPVPTRVLEFSHEQPTMDLQMEWANPKHLIVKYGNAGLVSQMTECAGIDITVQNVSNGAEKSTKAR